MRKLLVAAFLLLNVCLHAQVKVDNHADTVYPAFAGGIDAWMHFLKTKLHPDLLAKRRAPAGTYVVTVSFFIDTSGNVCAVTIMNDPGYGAGDDVLKAFQHCPAWTPAILNNRKVVFREQQDITYNVDAK